MNFKILILGNSDIGKTNYLKKLTLNLFNDVYKASITSEYGFKNFEYEVQNYGIQLWDLAGCEKNGLLTKLFAKDSHGYVIMVDSTDISTRDK